MHRKTRAFVPPALLLALALTLPAAAVLAADETPEPEQPPQKSDPASTPQTESEKKKDGDSFFERVTVTATGRWIDTLETPVSVTVIEREEIDRRAADNPVDLLRGTPGVDVNGVGFSQPRPIIRGQRGLRILVMEDGLRLNNPRRQTDFGEIPTLIDQDGLQAVEVVRGPASVLYGTDAIGGVVNLVSARRSYAEGTLAGEVNARWGSAGDRTRFGARLGGRLGGVDFEVGVHKRSAGDYEVPAGTFGDVTLDRDTDVVDTGVDDDGLFARLAYDLDDRNNLSLEFDRYRADQTGFGYVDPPRIGDDSGSRVRILYPYQDFDRQVLRWEGMGYQAAIADSFTVSLYNQSNERELTNLIDINIGPIFPGAPDSFLDFDSTNFTDVDTTGLRTEARKLIGGRNLLTYGVEGYRDESRNTDLSTTVATINLPFPPFSDVSVETDDIANTPNATNTSWGVFAQNELRATDDLNVILGARYQSVETNADPTPGLDIAGLDFEDEELVGTLSLLYDLTERFRLTGSYGTAFRAPNIVERLFNGPVPEGSGYQIVNADLVSERSDNVEFGFKWRAERAFAELTAFRNDVEDAIVQAFLTPDEFAQLPQDLQDEITDLGLEDVVVQQRNEDTLRYEGFELAAGYRFRNGFVLGGNYTHVDAENLTSQAPTQDSAGDFAYAWLRWQPAAGRWWAEYRVRHNDSQETTEVGFTVDAFTVHTVAAGLRIPHRGLQHLLGVTVENATDELYAETSNALFFRPQPGRNVTVDYKVRF